MRSLIRKPNIKKSISARTTGKVKRKANKIINPTYGKIGMGYINNPQKAIYNRIYTQSSRSLYNNSHTHSNSINAQTVNSTTESTNNSNSLVLVTNSSLPHLVIEHPKIIDILRRKFIKKIIFGIIFIIVSVLSFFVLPIIGIINIGIAFYFFYDSYKFYLAYSDAKSIYWRNKLKL